MSCIFYTFVVGQRHEKTNKMSEFIKSNRTVNQEVQRGRLKIITIILLFWVSKSLEVTLQRIKLFN